MTGDAMEDFNCLLCGVHVYRYATREQERVCFSCLWLREHPKVPEDIKRRLTRHDDDDAKS
jgi:hypothetical protein